MLSLSSPVLLLHGWAANHHVFDDLITKLPAEGVYLAPDLPGHGVAAMPATFDVAAIANDLAATLTEPVHLVGWSLGGHIALYLAAHHPHLVKSLCLTASFAKFLAATDHPEGLKNPALAKMVTLFNQDFDKYMTQFFQLQFLYAKENLPILKQVLPLVCQYGPPPALALALEAIEGSDARACLSLIQAPTLLLFGQKDAITPAAMGTYLHQHIADSQLHFFERASHAPFLSHADEFAHTLTQFWATL
ncbi:MAG: pimeloyl-ACP methyl ester esterase BioH [Neisseriaceae bacterium]|nr:pimeloyl-ACP methyl ester esterase BioH [Neisseriaceae bacterium]MBP6863140.1 pimeloyl-ACP methyl ester esterase BioH [Neisseriaceae bacterium]